MSNLNLNQLKNKKSKKLLLIVFSFFLLINFMTAGGHTDSTDGNIYFLVTESTILNHSIKIDPSSSGVKKINYDITNYMMVWAPESNEAYLRGEIIPFYIPGGILGPELGVPWYGLALIFQQEPLFFVSFFTNSIIMSLTSLIVFFLGKEFFKSYKIGFVLAVLFSVTSFIWPYNSSLFLQPAQALTLIASFYFITIATRNNTTRHYFLGGLFLALSILIHPSSAILVPGLLAYTVMKSKDKKLTVFFLTFTGTVLIQLVSNYIKFGSLFDFGYKHIQSLEFHNSFVGLVGLIFSPGWGLLFYFPLMLLLPIALYKMYKINKAFFFLILYLFFVTWIFFGTQDNPHWSGFGAWGPRYFIPIIPFATLALGYLFDSSLYSKMIKVAIPALSIAGFAVNILGKLVWYQYGYHYAWDKEMLWKIPDSFSVMAWEIIYSPIILHFKILGSDYLQKMDYSHVQNHYANIGLYPCPVDFYLFCEYGLGITVIGFVAIFLLGYITYKITIKNDKLLSNSINKN